MASESRVVDQTGRRVPAPQRIEYAPSSALPKLAWLATLDTQAARLSVLHGRTVECRPNWLVEGVWDGPFEAGDFHRGAHLFGSGLRLDGDAVHFVPAAALVDRLVYCWDGARLLVSNSILALLAATGAEMDSNHDYIVDANALLEGVDRYDSSFHVLHPSIERFHQIFHKTLVFKDGVLTVERTIPVREFTSFEEYVAMLRERLAAICENARDPGRSTPLEMFGTLSSGYDSTAISALVKDLGVRRYFTHVGSAGSNSKGQPEYETAAIAAALGIETINIDAPQAPAREDELLVRAATPLGQQMPLIAMAKHIEENAAAAIVFMGFHGDMIWDMNVPDAAVSEGIIRHDLSGLDLSELRLKSGFFNVAVPFFYAASIKSIVAISRSAEMAPWKVGTDYDRPISRRIVESAGVPRERFGFLKGGIFTSGARPLSPQLRAEYRDYVAREVTPPPILYLRAGCDRYTMWLLSRAGRFAKRRLRSKRLTAALASGFRTFREGYSWYGRRNYRVTLYAWAVTQLVRELRARGLVSGAAAAD